MARTKDYLLLHFIVLIWGFTAILGVLIHIPPVEIVFYRTLFATLGLGAVVLFKKKSFIVQDDFLKILGTGFLINAHWILFFASARVSNISVCLAGISTISFFTAILEPIFHKRKIRLAELLLGTLVILGLYLIFRFEFDHALGLGLALLSALLASLFSVINSKLMLKNNAVIISFYEMAGACIGSILFFPLYVNYLSPQGLELGISISDLTYLLILAWVCTVFAYTMSVNLMKTLTPFSINLAVNLEPVYGILLALLIFGDKEKMGSQFYLGASIIVISVFLQPLLNRIYLSRKSNIEELIK